MLAVGGVEPRVRGATKDNQKAFGWIALLHDRLAGGVRPLFGLGKQPLFLSGVFLYGLSALIWFSVISSEQLSTAYPILVSMTFILVTAGSVVFFHEVTIPPGTVEGTHQHIGSEELYYITEGTGVAYMREGDDPSTDRYPTVTRDIYGIGPRACKELPVQPGSIIFTKSGGMHGIRNQGQQPLRFVAFLYHTA